MNQLASFCKDIKQSFHPKKRNRCRPVSCWSEKDVLNGKIIDAFVIILYTPGCSWALHSGCSMCGYFNDSAWQTVTEAELLNQVQTAMDQYNNEPLVKIFTSGSFLDDSELSKTVQYEIINRLSVHTKKISVESRPSYVTEQKLDAIQNHLHSGTFEVGIGLETANEYIRKHCINKGFSYTDYQTAAERLKNHDFSLKTYVLVKPPFLTEQEAINDSIQTIVTVAELTDIISLNPTNVQRHTLVEYLWKRQQYRPAWLWSVIEILKTSKKNHPDLRLQCDVAGGGKPRGAHNCKQCDHDFLNAIKDFSLTQRIKDLSALECQCKPQWLDQLELEPLSFGAIIDTQRWKHI